MARVGQTGRHTEEDTTPNETRSQHGGPQPPLATLSYRNLELPGANPLKDAPTALDAAVLAAYGFSANKDVLAA